MSYTLVYQSDYAALADTAVGTDENSTTGVPDGSVDFQGSRYHVAGGVLQTEYSLDPPLNALYRPGDENYADGKVLAYSANANGLSVGAVGRFNPVGGGTGFGVLLHSNGIFYFLKSVAGVQSFLTPFDTLVPCPAAYILELTATTTSGAATEWTARLFDQTAPAVPIATQSYTDSTAELQSSGAWGVCSYGNVSFTRVETYSADAGLDLAAPAQTAAYKTAASVAVAAASGGTNPKTYQWYRGLTSGFTPGPGNILAGATAQALADTGLLAGTTYYYKVKAADAAAGVATSPALAVTTVAPDGYVVLFIGDSITFGIGSSGTPAPSAAVAALNAAGCPAAGVNAGVSGTPTGQWTSGGGSFLAAALAAGLAVGCDTASVMLGTNDSKVAIATTAEDYAANLSSTIASLLAGGTGITRVVLNVPPYLTPDGTQWDAASDPLLQQYAAAVAALANGTTVLAGDTTAYAHFAANTGQLVDGIHPTQAGHTWLGGAWADAFAAAVGRAAPAYPAASDVRAGVDRGDGTPGTLVVGTVGVLVIRT